MQQVYQKSIGAYLFPPERSIPHASFVEKPSERQPVLILQILCALLGIYISALAVKSAVRTFVLPRSAPDNVTSIVFRSIRWLFNLRVSRLTTYEARDQLMAYYAPVALLSLLPTWLFLVDIGHILIFYGLGVSDWQQAFVLSGSSLLTLGFAQGTTFWHILLAFEEATTGLILVALLIAYLPTIYTAFSRRENAVTRLAVRAGEPPSAVEMLLRFNRLWDIKRHDMMDEVWTDWEIWFSEIEESHTSLPALVFFRSPQPDHSWVTAAGAVLDAASLTASVLDLPPNPRVNLCIRAGFIALRRIADFFGVEYNKDASFPADPISISRVEFDEVYDRLAAAGVPVKTDREQVWQDFAGWRVNYDRVLLALCRLTMAPYAMWSSDRSPIR